MEKDDGLSRCREMLKDIKTFPDGKEVWIDTEAALAEYATAHNRLPEGLTPVERRAAFLDAILAGRHTQKTAQTGDHGLAGCRGMLIAIPISIGIWLSLCLVIARSCCGAG